MADRIVRYIITGSSAGAVRAFKETEDAANLAGNRVSRAGKSLKGIGSNMTQLGYSLSRVSLPLALLGGYAVKSAIDFQSSMTLLRTQAGASSKEVGELSNKVLALKNAQQSPKQLAEALYYIRSEGYHTSEAMRILAASQAGASISGANLTETARNLTAILKVGLPDVHGAADAMNKLDAIVGGGALKWEELNQALSTGFLATVKKAGLGLNDVGAAFDAFSRRRYPPSQTATNFRKALIQMIDINAEGKKSLAKIGISQYELANDLRKPQGLVAALTDLETHLTKVGKNEGNAILAQTFGRSKGAGTIFQLLETTKEQQKILGEYKKYGTLKHNLAIEEQTDQAKIKIAIVELQKVLISLGNTLIPVVIPAFQKLAKLLAEAAKWFTGLPKPIKEVGTYLGIAAVVAGPLLILFGNLFKVGGGLLTVIGRLTKVLPGFGATARAAGTDASVGISGLLLEVGELLAAAAAVYAMYKAIEAIKNFLSSSSGKAHSPGAKALKKLHQPSEFGANTGGAFHMLLGGAGSGYGALAPGSAGEANYLRAHAGALGNTTLGGAAAAETPEGRAFRKALEQRNQEIVIHNKIDVDGKTLAESTATHIRNHASGPIATRLNEGLHKNTQHYSAREK